MGVVGIGSGHTPAPILNVPFSIAQGIKVDNTVFVMKNGDDALGMRERFDLPFLTVTAALAAAVSGDCVVVYPGTYDENNLLKNEVDQEWLPGAIADYTGADTRAVFDDNNSQVVSNIKGDMFKTSAGNSRAVFHLENLNSDVRVDAFLIEAQNSAYAVEADDGTFAFSGQQIIGRILAHGSGGTRGVFIKSLGIQGSLELDNDAVVTIDTDNFIGNLAFSFGINVAGTSGLSMRATNILMLYTPAAANEGFIQIEDSPIVFINHTRFNNGFLVNGCNYSSANEAAGMQVWISGFCRNQSTGTNARIAVIAQDANIDNTNNSWWAFTSFVCSQSNALESITTLASGFMADVKYMDANARNNDEPANINPIVDALNVDANI